MSTSMLRPIDVMRDASARSAGRYVARLFTFAALFAFLAAVANWIVDPFNLNGYVRISGFNTKLGKSFNTPMLTKAYVARRLKPEAIVVGSSRTDHALDVNHPGWNRTAAPRYNLSVERADIYELVRFLEHAQSIHPLKQVVFGLDLFMFNKHAGFAEGFEDTILGDSTSKRSVVAALRHTRALFSFDTLSASLYTIFFQGDMYHSYDEYGRRTAVSYEQRLRNSGGYRAAFREFSRRHAAGYQQVFDFDDQQSGTPLDAFRKAVVIAHRDNIDLRFFISPTHALEQEIWLREGKWPLVERWKRELVRILAEESANNGHVAEIPLWDFGGYNTVTTEPIPPATEPNHFMQWYWEPSHYKLSAGNLVLDRIFDFSDGSRSMPPDFGVKIKSANIEQHLATVRRAQDDFRLRNAQMLTEMFVRP